MKTYTLLFALIAFFEVNAQAAEEKKLTVDKQTSCELRYYYFPNMQAYYDMKDEVFRFQVNNEWTTSGELPQYYGGYSLFKNEKVIITDYDGDQPEQFIKTHKEQYPFNPKGRIKRPTQPVLDHQDALAIN